MTAVNRRETQTRGYLKNRVVAAQQPAAAVQKYSLYQQ